TVEGSDVPYDSVIFLHKYDPRVSFLYSIISPESICVFLKPDVPVLTSEHMGGGWPVVSQSEVYSLQPIPPQMIRAVIMPDAEALNIDDEIQRKLASLSIPLFGTDGSRYC
ncbi:MAG: hypothetical protein AAB896_01790, partial [Patescibacteria group bacterium]